MMDEEEKSTDKEKENLESIAFSNNNTRLKEEVRKSLIKDLERKVDNVIDGEVTEEMVDELMRQFGNAKEEAVEKFLKRKMREEKRAFEEVAKQEETFTRFGLNFRIQHMTLFTSVLLLIITGMPEKFHEAGISGFIINSLGGIKIVTILHRIGAVGLSAMFAYHCTIYTILFRQGRKDFVELLPMPKDLFDVIQMIKYFFGLSKERPKFGRFSYIEKFDYWAVYWGCMVMIGSGVIMWFEIESMNLFGKVVVDIAKEAHSDEGLLCALAILIWHFYNVHLNPRVFPMSWVWWNGKLTKEEMIEEHPLEYERIMKEKEANRQ